MPTKVNAKSPVKYARLEVPQWIDAKALAAGVAETYTVPTDVTFVILSGTQPFYINVNGVAAVPGDTSDGTASLYVPSGAEFEINSGASLSIMSPAISVVTIGCYK